MNTRTQSRIRNKANAKMGNLTEALAELWLERNGYACIEPIERSWIPKWRSGKIVGAIPKKKVSGDFTAIKPGTGQYVHIEVKSRDRITLRWSDLEEHQRQAMDEKVAVGAECLLIWVKDLSVQVYQWPVPGFGPGKSLQWQYNWNEGRI